MTSTPRDRLSRALLDAARDDRPSPERRSRIWERVAMAPQLSLVASAPSAGRASVQPGAAAGGTPPIHGGLAGALSAGKLVLAGAVAGSMLTIGVGVFLLRGSPRANPAGVPGRPSTVEVVSPTRETTALPPPTAAIARRAGPDLDDPPALSQTISASPAPVPAGVRPQARRPAPASVASVAAHGDTLMQEVAWVAEARRQLGSGQATAALASLDAASAAGSRSLELEELALRVRALRILGRDVESRQAEATLRARYPENFLSR